jgi:hypothetical protein
MAATNSENSKKKYYKLREDKTAGSPTEGQMVFYEQVKQGDKWVNGPTFNQMSGNPKGIKLTEYQFEGKPKQVLNIELLDDADNETILVFTLGFNTNIAQSILNTLAGEAILGVLQFNCGKPSVYNGKSYPTLYINNGGQKTKWKYSKENNNLDQIPKITTITDEEGNTIKKGVKANNEFWLNVLKEVTPKFTGTTSIKEQVIEKNNAKIEDNTDDDGLPF